MFERSRGNWSSTEFIDEDKNKIHRTLHSFSQSPVILYLVQVTGPVLSAGEQAEPERETSCEFHFHEEPFIAQTLHPRMTSFHQFSGN